MHTFNEYKWKNRLLLVKSSSEELYNDQVAQAKKYSQTYIDRKIKVLTVDSENELIKEFPNKSIFLIGLDGNVKSSSRNIYNESELVKLIDSMPMRQQELLK